MMDLADVVALVLDVGDVFEAGEVIEEPQRVDLLCRRRVEVDGGVGERVGRNRLGRLRTGAEQVHRVDPKNAKAPPPMMSAMAVPMPTASMGPRPRAERGGGPSIRMVSCSGLGSNGVCSGGSALSDTVRCPP